MASRHQLLYILTENKAAYSLIILLIKKMCIHRYYGDLGQKKMV